MKIMLVAICCIIMASLQLWQLIIFISEGFLSANFAGGENLYRAALPDLSASRLSDGLPIFFGIYLFIMTHCECEQSCPTAFVIFWRLVRFWNLCFFCIMIHLFQYHLYMGVHWGELGQNNNFLPKRDTSWSSDLILGVARIGTFSEKYVPES